MPQTKYPIVIVGAGISGLALGYYLNRSGAEAVILEAESQPGGVIESRRCKDHLLELGPQRTRLTPPLRELVDTLELTDQLITAPDLPLYVFAGGKLRQVPLDLHSALTTDLLSWWDRARALAEPLTRGLTDGESTADYFIRKFGRSTYDRLFGPLFGDLYGSDPAEMPARHALASYLQTLRIDGSLLGALIRGLRKKGGAPMCTFQNGLQTLTDALASQLGDRLRISAPVREIYKNGQGLRVVSEDEEIRAAHVVLTCPAPAASSVIARLDDQAANALAYLQYNSLTVVHLHAEKQLQAMGYQIAFDSGYATCGVTYNEALFDRRGVYTAFLGGAKRPGVADLGAADLGELAAREFEAVTGAGAAPVAVHRTQMPAWDTSWDVIDRFHPPEQISICANWKGRLGITGRLREAAGLAKRLVENGR